MELQDFLLEDRNKNKDELKRIEELLKVFEKIMTKTI